MESSEVHPRLRHQGGQAGDEVEWFQNDMGGAVCGGPVKIIACIEDPVVINKILRHLQQQELKVIRSSSAPLAVLPPSRASPVHQPLQDDWLNNH